MAANRPIPEPPGPRVLIHHRLIKVCDLVVIIVFVFTYFAIRGLMDGQEAQAFANAESLIRIEQRFNIFWEPAIQQWTLQYRTLTDLANWIYIWGHWPVVAGTLMWLLWFHRRAFATFRNAMLLSGAIGLVIFAMYPVAPPRFLPDLGFVDVVMQRSASYRVLQPPSLANLYAAMPSLHVGWNLLMGIAITRHASGLPAKLFGLLMPVAMFLSVVATGNHYLLDGLAGSTIALAALIITNHPGRGEARRFITAACDIVQTSTLGSRWRVSKSVDARESSRRTQQVAWTPIAGGPAERPKGGLNK